MKSCQPMLFNPKIEDRLSLALLPSQSSYKDCFAKSDVSEPQKMLLCLSSILLNRELPVLGLHPISTDMGKALYVIESLCGSIFDSNKTAYKGDQYYHLRQNVAMSRKDTSYEHQVFHKLSDLPEDIQKIVSKAKAMTKRSYAPYSGFYVGAALITENGKVHKGCNQENASYPLCICAERVALYSYGATTTKKKIKAIAITAEHPQKPLSTPCMPCGACRQVIQEFEERQGQPIDIYVTANNIVLSLIHI